MFIKKINKHGCLDAAFSAYLPLDGHGITPQRWIEEYLKLPVHLKLDYQEFIESES